MEKGEGFPLKRLRPFLNTCDHFSLRRKKREWISLFRSTENSFSFYQKKKTFAPQRLNRIHSEEVSESITSFPPLDSMGFPVPGLEIFFYPSQGEEKEEEEVTSEVTESGSTKEQKSQQSMAPKTQALHMKIPSLFKGYEDVTFTKDAILEALEEWGFEGVDMEEMAKYFLEKGHKKIDQFQKEHGLERITSPAMNQKGPNREKKTEERKRREVEK